MTPAHLLAFAVAFAMTGICTALALQGGSNPLTVVTVRTVTALALLLAWFYLMKVPFRLPRSMTSEDPALDVHQPLSRADSVPTEYWTCQLRLASSLSFEGQLQPGGHPRDLVTAEQLFSWSETSQ